MNGYLLSVIGTILLSALLTAILPNGKTSAVIKAITKLACLLVIISPVFSYIQAETGTSNENSSKNLSQSVIQTDESFITYYSEMRIQNAQVQLESEIKEKFGLDCRVVFTWEHDKENIRIIKLTVQPQTELSEQQNSELYEYLTKNYCSEVVIE